jgi:DNA-binding HxlR family transcriptional regulator
MQIEAQGVHTKETCSAAANAIRDALYVIGGKWKLPILMALAAGPHRFRELQHALQDITPKVLSKELKDLELNEFVSRTVHPTTPVTVEYALTGYSNSLQPVLLSLRDWGVAHRKRLKASLKAANSELATAAKPVEAAKPKAAKAARPQPAEK